MIQSIGWIVYHLEQWEPQFFIMKRRAMSWKIERVAPKWKMEANEKQEFTCVREISEETGMDINALVIKTKLSGGVELKNMNFGKGTTDKSISYFLVEYKGSYKDVVIPDVEGLTWMYKWSTMNDIMNLVPYRDLRAVFREAYEYIDKQNHKKRTLDSIMI